jgi:hypothetical protein
VPAAAVIPAPIAYIKVAAVKKLVVGSQLQAGGSLYSATTCTEPIAGSLGCPSLGAHGDQSVYFEKIRVLKAGECLNSCAWNNEVWPRYYFVGSWCSR